MTRPPRAPPRAPTRALRWSLAWWRSKARPVPFVLIGGYAAAAAQGRDVDLTASSPSVALAEALTRRGLTCTPADVAWVDGPSGVGGAISGRARALVRASATGGLSDLYLAETRLSPEGAVLRVGNTWNLTNTSGVDESVPLVTQTRGATAGNGPWAAYATSADGLVTAIHVIDLAGEPPEADFSRVQRAQVALTNLQQTGQGPGISHTAYMLDPVGSRVAIAWRAAEPAREPGGKGGPPRLEVQADERLVVIDPVAPRVVLGSESVRVVRDERARPGNVVTWAVDRVRALSWFGDDRMQWVKAVAFTLLDRAHETFAKNTTAEDVSDEMGLAVAGTLSPGATAAQLEFVDPDVGWPPAPMKLAVARPLPGEGQWITLEHDAFITPTPSRSPPAFVTSFVRPNAQRLDVRVYVTLWDPRQVALHMEAGTVEPISANGEHGSGMIPRAPEVLGHVVAAFNGGFQAQHGEYGMQANGIEYLPPKPYAASVVELRDGSNGFGAWPDSANIPDDVIGMRQNLTALVEFGRFNPWGRNWWGGAPPGWPDQIHTARSAICMTTEGFAGYFYSSSIAPEDLAQGMLLARCAFGIHLDMNAGHAGFEFYDVAPEGGLSPLARPLQPDWEAQGKVPEMPGYVFRARRMIRGMGHMLFPRYIQREARDFFYLTSRAILPGAPIPPASDAALAAAPPEALPWRTRGLPQHGFPYALATTRVHVGAPGADLTLSVVRADPRTMRPAGAAPAAESAEPEETPTVLAFATTDAHGRAPRSVFWHASAFALGRDRPSTDAVALAGGCAMTEPCAAAARSAVGVQDEDGMLAWVELPSDAHADTSTAAAMDALLVRLGCSARMAVAAGVRIALGGTLDVAGDPAPAVPSGVIRLVRAAAPDAHPIFPSTPLVPIQVWQPLQAKRVRYLYKPPYPRPAASE